MKKIIAVLAMVAASLAFGCSDGKKKGDGPDNVGYAQADGSSLAAARITRDYESDEYEDLDVEVEGVEVLVDQAGPAVAAFGIIAVADTEAYDFGSTRTQSVFGDGSWPYFTNTYSGQGDASGLTLSIKTEVFGQDNSKLISYTTTYEFTDLVTIDYVADAQSFSLKAATDMADLGWIEARKWMPGKLSKAAMDVASQARGL